MKRATVRAALGAASVVGLLGIVAGCETAPDNSAALADARSAVQKAESNPNVTKYAATELDRARKLLTNAEGSAEEKGADDEITSHYAYLATQLARIAEQRANERVAVERVKQGETERQQILLAAREQEASSALAAAQQARSEAMSAREQTDAARQESQRLAQQLEEMEASQTSRGIVLTLDDVLFDTGRAELKPGAARSLDQIVDFLQQHPERRVQIEGFTDSVGSAEFNQDLSQRRADEVARAIIQRGIDAQRIRAMGYGESYPVASNTNPGSRQLNRRVEIIVSNDQQAVPSRTATGQP